VGRATGTFVDLLPRTAKIALATSPPGLQVTLDGRPVTTPASDVSVVGMSRTLGVISPQTSGGATYEFDAWSDGGSATHVISSPASDTIYTANYRAESVAPGASNLMSVSWGTSVLPAELDDFVGYAENPNYGFVINADGTVTGWGANWEGVLNVPDGLSNVVAVAVGKGLSIGLALKADGTVVKWGRRELALPLPTDLTNVVAIAAGGYHALALRRDGTVSPWLTFDTDFGQTKVPDDLNNVVAIGAGFFFSVALKADATAVAWGRIEFPPGLTNLTAIAVGRNHSSTLTRDGTAVAAHSAVPPGLANLHAISAGEMNSMALNDDGTVVQ